MIPSWNRRTWVHGDPAEINPFGHRMPAPARVIVADGDIQEGMEDAFKAANPDGLELTPPSRLGAIHTTYSKPIKPKKPFESEEVAVETIVELAADVMDAEHYVQLSTLVKRDSVLDADEQDYEKTQDAIPWEELKAA